MSSGAQRMDAENKYRNGGLGLQEYGKATAVGLGVRNVQGQGNKGMKAGAGGARAKGKVRPRVGLRRL